ncbi:MAG TPA: ABC transporter permease [Acidimicrobiales bacterium]
MAHAPLPELIPPPRVRQKTIRPRRGRGSDRAKARELLANLVRRDLKVRHRGTVLGMLWSLTTPLLLVALYYFVFKVVFKASPALDLPRPDRQSIPFAVYFFAGLTLWNLFGNSITASTMSIVGSGYLLNKVYFPRSILPLSVVLSSLVTFGFELAVLLIMAIAVFGLPSLQILWLPLIVAVVALLSYGIGLFLATITVFLRDVAHFIGVLLQLWFWGSPVIYSLQFVADRPLVHRLLELNPMTGPLVSFRNVVVLNHAPDFSLLAYSFGCAVVALAVGGLCFKRWERLFSEIV